MKLKSTIILTFLITVLCYQCEASDVLFVGVSSKPSIAEQKLEVASRFYGLDIETFFVGEAINNSQIVQVIKRSDARAMVITARALASIDAHQLLSALHNEREKGIPLLIMGVTPACNENVLRSVSGGAVLGCTTSAEAPTNGFYKVAYLKDIARQLAGQDIPFNSERAYHFILEQGKKSHEIMQVVSKNKEGLFPVFVKTIVDGREVFFQVEMSPSHSPEEPIWEYDTERFFEIAPLMMFLRYSCGERCWHSVGNYANLTIDDPWLIEPYGHLSYKGLLEEMQKANFHTTIAFIPWNYDRSKPEVVSLFSEHPDRFSISIHGNNHDHYEFYKYETEPSDPWSAKPLNVQEENIKQSIARMEKFRNLTYLPYDRVMVFPHGIAPAKTLGLLKKYNFLATVNAGNIPLGEVNPADPLYQLRPVTLAFESFCSITRYSLNQISQSDIGIQLFLDNPILFYAHHDFFEDGIDAFNKTAKIVNNLETNIVWQSLGYIARHLYLQKLRDDGNYDVMALCSNIVLQNTHQRDVTFFVRKDESFSLPIKQLTVAGHPYVYERTARGLNIKIPIPAGKSRRIAIEYENGLNLSSVDVSKNGLRVNSLRKLSDFRDITLSKNVIGRKITDLWYETGLFKLGLMRLAVLLFILGIIMASGGWYLRRRFMKR